MKVYVMTSDRYLDALRPFAYLFNRYWSSDQPVVVCGFTPPSFSLPPNFSFLSLGDFADYPINRWSDAWIKVLSLIPDDPAIFMLDDYWIIRPVYKEAVRMLYDYCKQFRYVCRMDLTGDRLHAGGAALYDKCGHLELVWSDPDSQYHMSTMAAIWNPHNLKRVLIPGETPWQVELQGTPRLRLLRQEMIVLGSKEWPVRHTLAFRGGDNQKILLDEIDPADVAEMTRLELLAPWGVI